MPASAFVGNPVSYSDGNLGGFRLSGSSWTGLKAGFRYPQSAMPGQLFLLKGEQSCSPTTPCSRCCVHRTRFSTLAMGKYIKVDRDHEPVYATAVERQRLRARRAIPSLLPENKLACSFTWGASWRGRNYYSYGQPIQFRKPTSKPPMGLSRSPNAEEWVG